MSRSKIIVLEINDYCRQYTIISQHILAVKYRCLYICISGVDKIYSRIVPASSALMYSFLVQGNSSIGGSIGGSSGSSSDSGSSSGSSSGGSSGGSSSSEIFLESVREGK